MLQLAELAVRLQERLAFDAMLALVVEHASQAIGCPQTSLRLLDASRTRLLVTARAGRSVHERGDMTFLVGEGLVGWVAAESTPLRVDDAPGDPRFVVRAEQRIAFRSFLAVPLIASGQCIGVLSAAHPDPARFTAEHEQAMQLVAAICTPRLELARVERLAHVDPLTGTLNRRGLGEALALDRVEPPLGAALCDLDLFKAVNDCHGHAAGDEVLRHVGSLLGSVLRATDTIARWGGEEFAIALPGASRASARAVAERARAAVETTPAPTASGPIAVTISIGVASLREGESWDALLERADRALYRAKRAGRNRVEVDEDAALQPR